MKTSRKVIGLLFLSIYLLVLVHNIIPHFHVSGEQGLITKVIQADSHHHTHHQHDHNHNNHHAAYNSSDSGENLIHSIGHLIENLFHFDVEDDHFSNVPARNKIVQHHPKIIRTILSTVIWCPKNTKEIKNPYWFPTLLYERQVSTAVPPRAPPTLA